MPAPHWLHWATFLIEVWSFGLIHKTLIIEVGDIGLNTCILSFGTDDLGLVMKVLSYGLVKRVQLRGCGLTKVGARETSAAVE